MTFLSSQLRESAPYLQDEGWDQTAQLLLAAAAEIECLQTRLFEQKPSETPQRALRFDPHCAQPFNSSAVLISGRPLTDQALAFVKTRQVAW